MKAKVTIGTEVYYITFKPSLLDSVKNAVDEFEDHEDRDWYFISKDYKIHRLEDSEDVENLMFA